MATSCNHKKWQVAEDEWERMVATIHNHKKWQVAVDKKNGRIVAPSHNDKKWKVTEDEEHRERRLAAANNYTPV